MRRAYKNSYVQSQKMLASTVQFSTYDQTPPTRPRRTHPTPRGRWWYEEQDGPEPRSQNTPAGAARSLRTQQRAYGPVTHPHPVPRATKVTPY